MNEQLKAAIRTHLKFANLPLTAKELAYQVGVVEAHDSCPKVRKAIRSLIDDGYCIRSTSKGYEMATTAKEVQEYLNSLMQRQIAISNRIAAVWNAAKTGGLI